ncbi:DNA methyltransferase [Entomomonas asaccharolytica]|uniref:Methyltransferase n=1 Tax=Entomomonas asaccharolytica TaxID=2785331 RepID=A0A974NFL8_9GAMM|nr:DNA methyltransferase [Entomomonas asaccharolytica]QQP85741.1 site-specific DNA-methyltransferase [Entomomonas asaccharolytica]
MTNNTDLKNWLFNWTFKTRRNYLATHNIHKYPAVFIPELVEKIINTFSEQGETVVDIFAGSGTTLVESFLLDRKSIGIELNPLACLISKTKFTYISDEDLKDIVTTLKESFFCSDTKKIQFDNINYWFHDETIQSISDFLNSIKIFNNENIRNLILVSFSEIVRKISYCNHGGFKMHRDTKKVGRGYNKEVFFNELLPVLQTNINAVSNYSNKIKNKKNLPIIINSDSTIFQKDIGKNKADLIITSPPYGDSSTTVAYGQFSRLSSQILGLETLSGTPIAQLDNDLLGGKTSHIDTLSYKTCSITLQNIIELFNLRMQAATEKKESKKHRDRLKDIISFYDSLYNCMKNASLYLKDEKFFVLVTSSRVVHSVKLHTDLIIAEFGATLGFKLKNIYYRDIHNKRMPSKVSATNIKGETAPTMTEESIIVLQKTGTKLNK